MARGRGTWYKRIQAVVLQLDLSCRQRHQLHRGEKWRLNGESSKGINNYRGSRKGGSESV